MTSYYIIGYIIQLRIGNEEAKKYTPMSFRHEVSRLHKPVLKTGTSTIHSAQALRITHKTWHTYYYNRFYCWGRSERILGARTMR